MQLMITVIYTYTTFVHIDEEIKGRYVPDFPFVEGLDEIVSHQRFERERVVGRERRSQQFEGCRPLARLRLD